MDMHTAPSPPDGMTQPQASLPGEGVPGAGGPRSGLLGDRFVQPGAPVAPPAPPRPRRRTRAILLSGAAVIGAAVAALFLFTDAPTKTRQVAAAVGIVAPAANVPVSALPPAQRAVARRQPLPAGAGEPGLNESASPRANTEQFPLLLDQQGTPDTDVEPGLAPAARPRTALAPATALVAAAPAAREPSNVPAVEPVPSPGTPPAPAPVVPNPAVPAQAPAPASPPAPDLLAISPDLQGSATSRGQQVEVLGLMTQLGIAVRDLRGEVAGLRSQLTAVADRTGRSVEDFERRLALAEAHGAVNAAMGGGTPAPATPSAPVRAVSLTTQLVQPGQRGGRPAPVEALKYKVTAASPGLAMLTEVDRTGAPSLPVKIGDVVPGYGAVTAITQRGVTWSVKTAQGVIE